MSLTLTVDYAMAFAIGWEMVKTSPGFNNRLTMVQLS
jgi:hypothetical protein